MEDAPEMEPMMAEEMAEEQPKSQASKKPSSKKSSSKKASSISSKKASSKYTEYSQERPKDIKQNCCCCICACSNVKTDNETCFGCFPIKCGVVTIGVITLILATVLISYNFFLILNDYFAWYYPVIILVLYVPIVIACSFFIVFFTRDRSSTRGKLYLACMFIIISVVLKCIWTFIYIYYFYKQDVVYLGVNDPAEHHYIHYTKKFYIFMEIAYAIIIVTFFAYFMCVTERYYDLMKPEEAPEEMMSQKSGKSSAKSSKKSGM